MIATVQDALNALNAFSTTSAIKADGSPITFIRPDSTGTIQISILSDTVEVEPADVNP